MTRGAPARNRKREPSGNQGQVKNEATTCHYDYVFRANNLSSSFRQENLPRFDTIMSLAGQQRQKALNIATGLKWWTFTPKGILIERWIAKFKSIQGVSESSEKLEPSGLSLMVDSGAPSYVPSSTTMDFLTFDKVAITQRLNHVVWVWKSQIDLILKPFSASKRDSCRNNSQQ